MEKQHGDTKSTFSIQWKMLMMVVVATCFSVAIGMFSMIGLRNIETISTHIVKVHSPTAESVQRILLSMTVGRLATEQILDIDDYSQIDEINLLEIAVNDSFEKTNAFMAALMWGSETEAFRKSADGQNDKTWTDLGLRGRFIVTISDEIDTQSIGQTNIFYNGFIKKTLKAIELHLESLRLEQEGKKVAALEAERQSKLIVTEARHFYSLVLDNLDKIVEIVDTETEKGNQELLLTERKIQNVILTITLVGFLLSLILGILFSQFSIVRPLKKLTAATKEYGAGKLDVRITIDTTDEISELAAAFNGMAEQVSNYTRRLEEEVKVRTAELEKTKTGLEKAVTERTIMLEEVKSNLEKTVEERTKELNRRLSEAGEMNRAMVNRELKMIELKKEIAELKKKEE